MNVLYPDATRGLHETGRIHLTSLNELDRLRTEGLKGKVTVTGLRTDMHPPVNLFDVLIHPPDGPEPSLPTSLKLGRPTSLPSSGTL